MNEQICTTTKYRIGKTTYHVVSAASDKAKETIDIKINNIIKKSISEAEKPPFYGNNQ